MLNRMHKDRLFRFIFGNEEYKHWTLSLYNAVNSSNYEDPDELILNTIQDFLYIGMRNDVSFLIGGDMNIYEHQSSLNPNIPLRMMIYCAKLFENYIQENELYLYGSKLTDFPSPRFVVFYNGIEEKEDRSVLKLSSMFPQKGNIELTVDVFNINYGHNRELMELCAPLKDYAWFIHNIRMNALHMSTEKAADEAIRNMEESSPLKKVLLSHRSEVKGMIFTEFNEEEFIRKTKEYYSREGREEGRKEGREEGREEGTRLQKYSSARIMLKKGLPLDLITEVTGLSKEEIENIQIEE